MSVAPTQAPPVSVAVAIAVRDLDGVAATVEAVRRQVYEPNRIVVVGGDSVGRHAADELGLEWVSQVGGVIAGLGAEVTHIWIVQSGALPRPEALQTLLEESERVEAGIAGSKLLAADQPDRLVSVGIATDVFDVPYTGLDDHEVDHGQYDVVRDVAAVAGPSMLVRRDLARGLGGLDPLLEPESAAIDLCQRARLRGGRIVVVPSSEVLVPAWDAAGWTGEAGRIRSMLKVYSVLTLLWAIPVRFLVGLLEAVVAPFLGRWTLFAWARAWGWNVLHLPSTIRSRVSARHHRAVGDAELFRYQLKGSATLRRLGGETGERLRERLPGDDRLSLAELGRDLGQPAIIVGFLAVLFAFVASRSLWGGFPTVGYSFPLPQSGSELVGSYAGGWNPGGFGSTESLPPFLGLAGAVQTLLFDNPDLAAGALVFAAFVSGIWGTVRLVRSWGIEAVPGTLAGLVLIAGPATRAIGADTGLGTLVAVGILPWALRVPLTKRPTTRRARIARILGAAWVTGLMAVANPLLLPVPTIALLVLALVTPREPGPWRATAVAATGAVLATPMLLPWASVADLGGYVTAGAAYWEPGGVLLAAAGLAGVATVLAAPRRLSQVAGWAAVVAAVGAVVARSGDLGGGREVELAGMAVISLGSAVLVGVAFELVRREDLVAGWRRLLAGAGVVAAGALVVSTVLVLLPGRAGLPADDVGDALRFTAASEGDPAASRVLLVGTEDSLPGESRTVRGAAYRVVSAVDPALWEVWLPEPRGSDLGLEAVLEQLIDGESSRAGEDLAQFGIRWVIFLAESPLQGVLAGQLDLVPLQGLRLPTFASEATDAVRALTTDGGRWRVEGLGYVGPPDPGGRLVIADTANSRWLPDWEQSGWRNEVSTTTGEVRFEPIPERRTQAMVAFGAFALLLGLSWWGRRR